MGSEMCIRDSPTTAIAPAAVAAVAVAVIHHRTVEAVEVAVVAAPHRLMMVEAATVAPVDAKLRPSRTASTKRSRARSVISDRRRSRTVAAAVDVVGNFGPQGPQLLQVSRLRLQTRS